VLPKNVIYRRVVNRPVARETKLLDHELDKQDEDRKELKVT